MEGIKQKFKPYRDIIQNLTNSFIIQTKHFDNFPSQDSTKFDDVIDCALSKDSDSLVVLLKHSDELYKIRVFETNYFNLQLSINLGDQQNERTYIKAARIIQNYQGAMFCVPFLEDGLFKIQVFTKSKDMGRFDLS